METQMNNHFKLVGFGILLIFALISGCTMTAPASSPPPASNLSSSSAFEVNTFRDSFDGVCDANDCSLRDAVYHANNSSQDEIFLPRGTYLLNERIGRNDDSGRYGDLDISSRIIIQGEGIDISLIDGAFEDRVFHVLENGRLELFDLTLRQGWGDDPTFTEPSSLGDQILDCIFSWFSDCSNESTVSPPNDLEHLVSERGGGAIANRGIVKLDQVSIDFSVAIQGGAVYNHGEFTMFGGRICDNHGRVGGGVYNYQGATVELSQVLICRNGEIGKDPTAWGNDFSFNDESDITFYGGGGGIYNNDRATLLAVQTEFNGNSAGPNGSAIWNRGEAELRFSQIVENVADNESFASAILNEGINSSMTISGGGGFLSVIANNQGDSAIENSGKLTIRNTLIQDNNSKRDGAIRNFEEGNLAISQSLVSGNVGEKGPGGIGVYGGTLRLTNVSIGNNVGPTNRDICRTDTCTESIGAVNISGGFSEIVNVTIFGNDYGLVVFSGRAAIRNTILAGNRDFRGFELNCVGAISSLGHNLDSGESCELDGEGDLSSTDPLIIPGLDTSNAFTFTIPGNSPAIGNSDNQSCPPSDQQGEPRPMGKGCDIGADEFLEDSGVPLEAATSAPQATAVQPADEVAPVDPPTTTPSPTTPITTTPSETPTPTSTEPVAIEDPNNAGISGFIWQDANGDGSKQGGELTIGFQSVQLGAGACNSSGLAFQSSNLGGFYSFTSLAAGTYCVSVDRPEVCDHFSTPTTDTSQTVTLGIGESAELLFGYRKTNCVD
jgi:CSLREA domain-containing protein